MAAEDRLDRSERNAAEGDKEGDEGKAVGRETSGRKPRRAVGGEVLSRVEQENRGKRQADDPPPVESGGILEVVAEGAKRPPEQTGEDTGLDTEDRNTKRETLPGTVGGVVSG